jgi:hypothetical protein
MKIFVVFFLHYPTLKKINVFLSKIRDLNANALKKIIFGTLKP